MSQQPQFTEILRDLPAQGPQAADDLLPVLYDELRALAARKLANEPPNHTLQATALVHEAYLRLLGNGHDNWDNRGHFFSAAAEAMRRILIERARRYQRKKHGGEERRVAADLEHVAASAERPLDILALDEALTRFEAEDPIRGKLVKLRYFAGLTIEQTAELLGISIATANRHWTFARAWLCDAMAHECSSEI